MATRGFFLKGQLPANTTLISLCPGIVNTKLLIPQWGAMGVAVDQAMDTFKLATEDQFANPGALPKYYKDAKELDPSKETCNQEECQKFFDYMTQLVA